MPSGAYQYRAPRPPIVSFEQVEAQWMGPMPESRSPQIYPPMPPLPSEEPIPTPPPVEYGAAGTPSQATQNSLFTVPYGQPPQGVPAQYVPPPPGLEPRPQTSPPPSQPSSLMSGPSSIIPLPPLD